MGNHITVIHRVGKIQNTTAFLQQMQQNWLLKAFK